MNINQLAPDEPVSPELVLVFPPGLRTQALACLGAPVWPAAPQSSRVAEAPGAVREPFARSLGVVLAARVVQLGLMFAAVTILVLAMSVIAHAVR
ncbi:MAG TPA: hypothetical protein VGI69_03050 [Gaiellaceae bacterium]